MSVVTLMILSAVVFAVIGVATLRQRHGILRSVGIEYVILAVVLTACSAAPL